MPSAIIRQIYRVALCGTKAGQKYVIPELIFHHLSATPLKHRYVN